MEPQPRPTGPPQQQQQQQQPQQQKNASSSYETVFTNAKAGMEGVDAEHVKRVVYEASKGSHHFRNEQRKEAENEQRIARMQAQAHQLSAAELVAHTASMDAKLAELEAGRDLSRTWLHVDMDAFFAAVEELDQPSLRDRPFAVGGMSMISTASYAARKFGVRSAMPGFIAVKLCPQLKFVKPDFQKYQRASEQTRAIFREYDPELQAASLDEAALDVTDYCARHGTTGEAVAAQIRERVQQATRLTCSVGIAPNRMLAKICSDRNKPNGQFALEPSRDAVLAFMRDLNLRKVPGVGKVTQKMLAAFGIQTGGDLLQHRGLLAAVFTPGNAEFFAETMLGLGGTRHDPPPAEGEVARKGISHERTFRPLSKRADLEGKLRELADALAEDMAEEGLRGRTLTLKLKLSTFELRSRATTLPSHISSADDLYAKGLRLLHAEMPCELRLLGLRVSNFAEAGRRERGQMSIEQMLGPRQGQQHEQQQQQGSEQQGNEQQGGEQPGSSDGGGAGAQDGGGRGEEEAVHTSQVLSAGEELELTLREWRPAPQQGQQEQPGGSSPAGASAWSDGCDYSLPPSLLPSPTTAARFEREAATTPGDGSDGDGAAPAPGAAAGGGALPLHMPATAIDLMLHQAARKLDAAGSEQQADREASPADEDEQPPQPPQQQQQQQQTWPCPACTFANPKGSFWCDMCGTSRLPPRPQQQQASAGGAAMSGGKGGSAAPSSGSSGKGKRGRKTSSAPAGPSILRFMSQRQPSPPAEQQQQQPQKQQQQREPSPPAEQQQQEPSPPAEQQQQQQQPTQAAGERQQQREPSPSAEEAGAAPAEQAQQGGAEQAPQPPEAGPQQLPEAGQPPAAARESRPREEQYGGGLIIYDSEAEEEEPGTPPSPLLLGEDLIECPVCGIWIRGTRYQAHEDEHLARKLQDQENRVGRLMAGGGGDGGKGKGGGQGGGKKRGAGKAGGQSTLLSVFGKRPKQ